MADTANTGEVLSAILYSLQHSPSHVHIVSFADLVRRSRVVKRQLRGGGIEHVGIITLEVPAMVARAAKLPPDERDAMILLHMRREALNEVLSRMHSRIVLPGEVRM